MFEIGLFSYLERIRTGGRQLMALNRKFSLADVDCGDVVPMTDLAGRIIGLKDISELGKDALKML